MEKINGEKSIELMKKNFPKFSAYWEAYVRDFGSELAHS